MSLRPVKRLIKAKPTIEGAGVHLRRAFGFGNTSDFDPFLLLDDFRNDVPEDYLAGFPWHPHRGIETITYVLAGTVEHGDSMGNHGAIGAGDIQWMTAGSGIVHQEMPKGDQSGRMHGFQLWANLPAALKMTAPRYQEVKAGDIPEITDDDGTHVRVVCGKFWGTSRSGGWHRGGSDLSRRFGAAGPAGRPCRSRRRTTPSHTFSRGAGSSATRRARWRCRPNRSGGRTRSLPPRRTTARWFCLTAATRSRCTPGKTGSGFCCARGSHCESRWPGTGRS